MATVVVFGSVFLPALAMEPLAEALRERGHDVSVAAPWEPESAEDALRDSLAVVEAQGDAVIVVAHSNAGNFVPGVAASHALAGAVFVDAVLPTGLDAWSPVASALAAELDRLGAGDALPPWTRWFADDDVIPLFPDRASYDAVDAACPRVPRTFLRSVLDPSPRWADGLRGAYVRLSESAGDGPYDADARRARDRGWPEAVLDHGHLGVLSHPSEVADTVLALASSVGMLTSPVATARVADHVAGDR